MCGRFTLTIDALTLQEELNIASLPVDYLPRFNIAPGQPVLATTNTEPDKTCWLKWGLVPFWARDLTIGYRMINARSETITDKPAFRQSFNKRRCLIYADGFFEWQKSTQKGVPNQPYFFYLSGFQPFAFAGLWDNNQPPEGDRIMSCTIITCQANSVLKPFHDRMPVILDQSQRHKWLTETNPNTLQEILQPFSSDLMLYHPVPRVVNSPKFDQKECIDKICI